LRAVKRWWGIVALAALWLAAPARAAGPVVLGSGPRGLLALAAQDGTAFAVIGASDAARPFALVRSSGRGAGAPVAFGEAGAENADVDAGPDGPVVTWSREISSAFELSLVRADDLARPQEVAEGTGPPHVDAQAAAPRLAYPDLTGDVMFGAARLTDDAPEHRNLPLDARQGLVLDLDQQRDATQLRVLGDQAPTQPVVSLASLEGLDASLAADEAHVYVAFVRAGRAFLATAERRPTARWSTRRLADGASGRPAVARAGGKTHVAYARHGEIHLDDETLGAGSRPLLAADGGDVLVGWTRGRTALLVRTG
jgi:hypothetical protein